MLKDLEPQAHWIHGIGIGIGGYRSFSAVQKIGPFRKINLIIGQNNSGKSNLLRLLVEHYTALCRAARSNQEYKGFEELDKPRGTSSAQFALWLSLPLTGPAALDWRRLVQERMGSSGMKSAPELVDRLVESDTMCLGDTVSWFRYEVSPTRNLSIANQLLADLSPGTFLNDAQRISILQHIPGNSLTPWVARVLSLSSPAAVTEPSVRLIPAFRQVVASTEEKKWDSGGRGLPWRLVMLRDPGHTPEEQELKKKFAAVNEFLRSVTGSASATLEIPYTQDTILVNMNDRVLPLEALGTGIHQVIMIAAEATLNDRSVICIEEPEIHLHPILQRKLLRFLEAHTNNQYFVATHSAHFLQHPTAATFHVRLENGWSVVKCVESAQDKSEICVDLGYRASDIIQANCVIWVEGPSDRLYLRHWIQAIEPEFVEGLHYSIMFYGGRLLNHLSAKDPEVNGFISLRRLNRFISVVMDSDREKPGKRLNDTKKRIRGEFSDDSERGFTWVTQGREIENYIPADVLEDAIRKAHPSALQVARRGRFERMLRYRTTKRGTWKDGDKIKVARQVVQHPANLDQLDLRTQINRVVSFIRSANEN